MKTIAALFPGQGSQYPGMSKQLLDNFASARMVFEEAEDTIKLNLAHYCCNLDYAEELKKTVIQQPALLTHSYSTWKVLQSELGFSATYFAGHSLGEYSALVASARICFAEAVALVHERGKAMQEAVPLGKGKMVAVLRAPVESVIKVCQDVSKEMDSIVDLANYNSPQQQIISGVSNAVDTASTRLKELPRVICKELPVSAPFHSSLMSPAREKMQPFLDKLTFLKDYQGKIIANLTGAIAEDYESSYLAKQIDNPVLWQQSLELAEKLGVHEFVEIGPSSVLSALAKRTLKTEVKISNTDDIVSALEKYRA